MEDTLAYLSTVSDTHTLVTLASPIDENVTINHLPAEVSLYQLESYSFDLYLYLDYGEPKGIIMH
jgi:hypothetical protein